MYQWMASLISIALLAAVCDCLLSNPTMKHLLRLIVYVSLITAMVTAVVHLDLSSYASALQQVHAAYAWDAASAEEKNRNLDRQIIESECSAYILNRAAELEVDVVQARVMMRWDTQGYWVPERAEIVISESGEDVSRLREAITVELGIADESQTWSVANET